MILIAYFTEDDAPKTGLTPTIDIWDLDATQVVTAQSMTEVAGGYYKYDFSPSDVYATYVIRADGGASLDDYERYCYAVMEGSYTLEDCFNMAEGAARIAYTNQGLLEDIEGDIADLDADVADLDADIADLDSDISDLQDDVTLLYKDKWNKKQLVQESPAVYREYLYDDDESTVIREQELVKEDWQTQTRGADES